MVDEVNILLGIISDGIGKLNFENYHYRMYVCYPQLLLSAFSCLWTLTASFFISLKLYDIIINNSRIFRGNHFLNKNITLITVSIPLIISYILWAIHLTLNIEYLKFETFYEIGITNRKKRFQLVFCWIREELSIVLACIAALLIIGNLYFSIFRGYFYLKKIKDTIITQNAEISKSINTQINNINQIQNILFLYPIISCVIWILFFLFIFSIYFHYTDTGIGWSIVFCIFMSIRQIIYTLVYFLSQNKLRNYTILFFMCKTCKKNKKVGKINPINLLPNSEIINDDSEEN